MAVVGGLVLSMSETFSGEGKSIRPQVLFHGGRLVSFFLFGGLIGLIGSAFTLSASMTFVLGVVVGIVMLVLGLNLLDIFPWIEKFHIHMPDVIAKRAWNVSLLRNPATPLIVGIATFFLPCGFTQSMQIYALSTGSFVTAGMTMFFFALGTLPALTILSFSSWAVTNPEKKKIFLKVAGVIVILFGLFNIANSFASIGLIRPLTSFVSTARVDNIKMVNGVQIIEMRARGGYQPRVSLAKAGLPTFIRFNTRGSFDCSSFVRIPSLGISKTLLQSGTTDINIGTNSVGTLRGTCGMGMYDFEIQFKE
jgi:sulfite exporter TauE/SafE